MAFPDDDKRYGGQYAAGGKHGLISWPSSEYAAVTPDDDNDLSALGPSVALYVGGAGDITVRCPKTAADITFTAVSGWCPIRTNRVLATGTSATGIVALF